MQVHFKIHGQGKKNLNGDGMAIWYTKERMQKGRPLCYLSCCCDLYNDKCIAKQIHTAPFLGPVFGNKDNFTGLGVFVDTYPNEEKQLEVRSNEMMNTGFIKQPGEILHTASK